MSQGTARFLYRDFVLTISRQFESEFSSIFAHYAFELGPEFEIALCNALGRVLPEKYGICRGYIVDAAGACAGDDIIIFDKIRFPTLLRSSEDRLTRKEYVPSEAVYAYIEAKHYLEIEEDTPQGINKALDQIKAVRQLCRERGIPAKEQVHYDRDQLFCMVISRGIRKRTAVIDSPEEALASFPIPDRLAYPAPDCIVCGNNIIAIPTNENNGVRFVGDVFLRHTGSKLEAHAVEGVAFGAGVMSLLHALNQINLGEFPTWQILRNAMDPTLLTPLQVKYILPITSTLQRREGETAQQFKTRRNDELKKLLPTASPELRTAIEYEMQRRWSFSSTDVSD
jgi:Domain of unknown function (DUF6602)